MSWLIPAAMTAVLWWLGASVNATTTIRERFICFEVVVRALLVNAGSFLIWWAYFQLVLE